MYALRGAHHGERVHTATVGQILIPLWESILDRRNDLQGKGKKGNPDDKLKGKHPWSSLGDDLVNQRVLRAD